MLDLMFLKLDGLRGTSFAPRHIGEIELTGFNWNQKYSVGPGSAGSGKAVFNDLVVYKVPDRTTDVLRAAWSSSRAFSAGELTVERVTETGRLMRTVRYKLRSIVLDFVSMNHDTVSIGLNFESMEVIGS